MAAVLHMLDPADISMWLSLNTELDRATYLSTYQYHVVRRLDFSRSVGSVVTCRQTPLLVQVPIRLRDRDAFIDICPAASEDGAYNISIHDVFSVDVAADELAGAVSDSQRDHKWESRLFVFRE